MYKIEIDLEMLRSGKEVKCPECKEGILRTKYNPKTSHNFKCDKCGMQINID